MQVARDGFVFAFGFSILFFVFLFLIYFSAITDFYDTQEGGFLRIHVIDVVGWLIALLVYFSDGRLLGLVAWLLGWVDEWDG